MMLILILVLLGIAGSAFAYTTIVKDYPTLNACQGEGGTVPCKPGDTGFGVPQFIKYLYIFAIGIVGIVGVMAIAMGAFGYVTSAGNPQAASSSKDKILSAVFGILLLLGAVVLLNMVNPDLLKFKTKIAAEIKITGEKTEETGCRPVSAKWEKAEINVGESVYLIFKLNKFCKEDAEISFCGDDKGSFLRQVRPSLAGDCPSVASLGWDPYCAKIYYTGTWSRAHDTDGSILLKYLYTFNKQCRDKFGSTECPVLLCPSIYGTICNFQKDKPETFYAEGQCTMKTGESFSTLGKAVITVKDGK
jgi:hypothetical protein